MALAHILEEDNVSPRAIGLFLLVGEKKTQDLTPLGVSLLNKKKKFHSGPNFKSGSASRDFTLTERVTYSIGTIYNIQFFFFFL